MRLPGSCFICTLLLAVLFQASGIMCSGCAGATTGKCKNPNNDVCNCPGCRQERCKQLVLGNPCLRNCVATDCDIWHGLRAGQRCFYCGKNSAECCIAKTCGNQNVACNNESYIAKPANAPCSTCAENGTECCTAKTCSNQNVTCNETSYIAKPANTTTCSSCTANSTECCTSRIIDEGVTDEKERLRVKLVEEQEDFVWSLFIIGAVFLSATISVMLISKFVYKDKDANYLTLAQCSLSMYDVISDIFFLQTIAAASDSFHTYYLFGAVTLSIAMGWGVVTAIFVIQTEKARKFELQQYAKEHPLVMALMCIFSPFKSNFILILDSRLFLSKTKLFDAPLPQQLRTKFTLTSLVSLVLEDLVQIALVASLQQDLSGWTVLNGISFSCSLLSLLGAACASTHRLKKSVHQRASKQLELQSRTTPRHSQPRDSAN